MSDERMTANGRWQLERWLPFANRAIRTSPPQLSRLEVVPGKADQVVSVVTAKILASARSAGGSDFDLDQLVALCRWCHDQTQAPYERSWLVVTALGDGQFRFDIVQRALKPRPALR